MKMLISKAHHSDWVVDYDVNWNGFKMEVENEGMDMWGSEGSYFVHGQIMTDAVLPAFRVVSALAGIFDEPFVDLLE
jgi:hypothetical protein